MSTSAAPQSGRRALGLLAALTLVAAGATIVAPGALDAQEGQAAADGVPEMTVEPEFPLYSAVLGPLSREITTSSPAAQAYFDQGLQMIYAFTMPAAVASFEEAQRQDPECAMCYLGEAWARGPYLNGGLRAANAPLAFEAVQRAVELAEDEEAATPKERALIDAMALRYEEEHDPDRRARLDSVYAQAMGELYRAYPEDLELGTLYAESLMLLNPRRALYRLEDPAVQRFHGILEEVLARDITHAGACHLYIHATEATAEPEKAEECADYLGLQIPGSSHIRHMPSHTYNRIGRWNSAVRSNLDAWHQDQKAAWEEGVSYGASHNLHMLLFAGSMAGQGAVSRLAAENYADQVPDGVFYEALVLLRFGWFDDILDLDEVPEQPIQRGLYEFAEGYAFLRDGQSDMARVYRQRVRDAAESTPDSIQFRGHTARELLGITGGILEGEILRFEGRLDAAIAAFEDAVELQDELAYDEPEPLNFAARHWLGAALLEAGRPEEAETVYRGSLEAHPHNGWSLHGLEQALRDQGRHDEADDVHEWFLEAWSDTDTLIRASRF